MSAKGGQGKVGTVARPPEHELLGAERAAKVFDVVGTLLGVVRGEVDALAPPVRSAGAGCGTEPFHLGRPREWLVEWMDDALRAGEVR